MNVCVFCASSNDAGPAYFEIARALGEAMAERGWDLVYGGGKVGLMGALAAAVHAGGGRVIGVIPGALKTRDRAYVDADELIVTADLRERKSIMDARSDAFIALPGGFGTLEEIVEVVTLRQLRLSDKPVVFVNPFGYFDKLFEWIDHIYAEGFAPGKASDLFRVAESGPDALAIIEKTAPPRAARPAEPTG